MLSQLRCRWVCSDYAESAQTMLSQLRLWWVSSDCAESAQTVLSLHWLRGRDPSEGFLATPPIIPTPSKLHVRDNIFAKWFQLYQEILYITGGKQKARRPNPALHLVLSGPAPCFYWAMVLSSCFTVKEQLHLYSPKITFGPLKATTRLMWSLVKMTLTPLFYMIVMLVTWKSP